MSLTTIVVVLFGIINIVGGFIGYFKAQSTVSLFIGGLAGLILLVCAYGISIGNNIAAIVSIIVAVLLGGRFVTTIVKKFKVMPDLIIIVFSLLTILVVGISFF